MLSVDDGVCLNHPRKLHCSTLSWDTPRSLCCSSGSMSFRELVLAKGIFLWKPAGCWWCWKKYPRHHQVLCISESPPTICYFSDILYKRELLHLKLYAMKAQWRWVCFVSSIHRLMTILNWLFAFFYFVLCSSYSNSNLWGWGSRFRVIGKVHPAPWLLGEVHGRTGLGANDTGLIPNTRHISSLSEIYCVSATACKVSNRRKIHVSWIREWVGSE